MSNLSISGIYPDLAATLKQHGMGWVVRALCFTTVALSVAWGCYLSFAHRTLGGPGDQLAYFEQASALIPFTHRYYGPVYFVTLRALHDILHIEWFIATKLVSLLSAIPFLLACQRLLVRLHGPTLASVGVALIALNPTFISETYHAYNTLFGATLICLALVAWSASDWRLLPRVAVSGFLFGIAILTRFQATGFLLGMLVGTLLTLRRPAGLTLIASMVGAGMAASVVWGWQSFLLHKQGFVPPNENFVHLTIPLGAFNDFYSVDAAVEKYRSLYGVLSDPGAIPKIFGNAVEQFLRFPLDIGRSLLGPGLLFVCFGALLFLINWRRSPGWYYSMVCGLFLTGIASRGWLQYYVVFLPFMVSLGIDATKFIENHLHMPKIGYLLGVLIVASIPWMVTDVRKGFREREWTEWGEARSFLKSKAMPCDLVSSSAASLPYGMTFRFVDRDRIVQPSNHEEWLPRLRAVGITLVVLTERHAYDEFPALQRYLLKYPGEFPAGVSRELFIDKPQALSVLRIAPTPSTCPQL
jgi:hypothetical protein